MDDSARFPPYIRRAEEEQIRQELDRVAGDGRSRAILLYGQGGIGKTQLVRHLARDNRADSSVVWVDPIDIDDSEYWLLSNLERRLAQAMDPDNEYFRPYAEYLSRLPALLHADTGQETVVSHLGRIKRVFLECYQSYVAATAKTVVVTFDAIEMIRGTYLQITITQWMKALPRTLFILSGRPPASVDDPLARELSDPHQQLSTGSIRLTEFSLARAAEYLQASSISAGLSDSERRKLVLLTRGHPLWLAFAIGYLADRGMPDEAELPEEEIERCLPFGGDLLPAGEMLLDDFRRRLVTPYREVDFWHEAIKRLTVLRQGLDAEIWRLLMADYPLPPGVRLEETWAILGQLPWIQLRANGRTITLHDAVADELAARVIPPHDQDHHWRQSLWTRAATIYAQITDGADDLLSAELATMDADLRMLNAGLTAGDGGPAAEEHVVIARVARLDAQKRSLDQLLATRFFYEMLCHPAAGCDIFLKLFDRARDGGDVLLQDLLAVEMQRFLRGGEYSHALGDVVGSEIDQVRSWLAGNPERHLAVSLALAGHAVEDQPAQALELLAWIEDPGSGAPASFERDYRLHLLRGNACMRIPGKVAESRRHFELALDRSAATPAGERARLIASAHKELAFCFRSQGMWREAEDAYEKARDTLLPEMTVSSPAEDHAEMAAIQANWAYVRGLTGRYRDGANLAESSIAVWRRLGRRLEEGSSWMVCGQVYRYERRFQRAWSAFARAEQIFQELRSWSGLGVVYQEQAICLHQAMSDDIELLSGRDSTEEARRLIRRALDICWDQSVRSYPSALNRAGRIFGADDPEAGLTFLAEGIESARQLSDGWFLLANLVEYVEASYRAWSQTEDPVFLLAIEGRRDELEQALAEYDFPDLRGRWELLQGHLAVREWQRSGDAGALDVAQKNYGGGFRLLALRYVGSSGAAMVPQAFAEFARHFWELPAEVRAAWQDQFLRDWSASDDPSVVLLARLEELY